jgi:glucokinase
MFRLNRQSRVANRSPPQRFAQNCRYDYSANPQDNPSPAEAMNTPANLPDLVADIGGTNARFCLATGPAEFTAALTLPCAEYASLSDAIRDYLSRVGAPEIHDAVIAIATAVSGDQIKMTNHHWSFSTAATQRNLGLRTLLVINDFAALAMALPCLGATQLERIDSDGKICHGVKAVIGPGTGLGVAGLVPTETGWQPLATEGGHVSLAPADPLELELLKLLWNDYPHVSAERLVSGPGLVLLYRSLCQIGGTQALANDSARIVELAAAGTCATARQTLSVFSGLLGGVAGNVALTLACSGGLYLGGGVLGKMGDQFDTVKFRQRFVAKGRFRDYLQAIPNYLITAQHPAFIGAAQHLRKHRML